MLISRLRLITFDVTDTLLKFRSSPAKKYGEIGAFYGVNSDEKILMANFKTHWRHMNKHHPNFGYLGIGWENWWKDVVTGTFKDSEFTEKNKQLSAITEHLINVYKTSACWQHCSGAPNLLSYLRSKGIPLGIVSNFDPRLDQILHNLKLKHFFQFVITSYGVGIEKPDSRIFEKAMIISKVKNLKSDECLHIGDKPLLDYYGARNSGWNAAIISDRKFNEIKNEYPFINSDDLFTNLYQLQKHFIETSSDTLSSHRL